MLTIKFDSIKNLFFVFADGKRVIAESKDEMIDQLFELGYDADEITFPVALGFEVAPIVENAVNDEKDVDNAIIAAIMIEASSDAQTTQKEVTMQATISYANNKFTITDIAKDSFVLSDCRYPNAKARAKKLGYDSTPDDSILNGSFTLEQGAPRRLIKSNGQDSIAHDKAVIETAAASVSIAKSEFSVKERFEFIERFTKLCAAGVIPSLIISGKQGGIGKSRTVMNTLSSLRLIEDTIGEPGDYVFVKGYSTARNLYTTLFNNNGKIVIFDDCDSAFKDPISANILKGALDSNGKRIITWGAESRDESIPSRFEFYGKVIFISNLPLDKFPQAILSRSMLVDLTLTDIELVDRIEQVFSEDTDFDMDDKIETLDFIKRNASKFKDLNVRSAFNALKMKVALGEDWERAALYSATVN